MEAVWIIVVLVAALVAFFWVGGKVCDAHEMKERRIRDAKSAMSGQIESLKNCEKGVQKNVRDFFATAAVSPGLNYSSVCASIDDTIVNWMEKNISNMEQINKELLSISRKENQSHVIEEEACVVSDTKKLVAGLKRFGDRVLAFSTCKMMDPKAYGKINKAYYDEVCSMQRTDVVDYISKCEYLLGSNQYDQLFAIDLEKVLKCVWFFAIEKSFAASDYQKVESVFMRIHKHTHADVILAGFYAKKKVGGDDILRDSIRNLLKEEKDSGKLTTIASGLMWMNAYQSENAVLQHMLATGKNMTTKMQERLHSLTNGGGKAPSGFEVEATDGSLYFDISALAWKDDEYVGLFENLAFQDKTLNYSLALRDEDKDLFIPQGIKVPDINAILAKIKSVFADEYGVDATAELANCIALSGSGEERMDGIIASAKDCKQMGILIYIARIGKKLIIKFYTLFVPTEAALSTQKQQALSMCKKLSPSAAMWESSLKDTMLMAVEQLLNTSVQPADSGAGTAPEIVSPAKDETIF